MHSTEWDVNSLSASFLFANSQDDILLICQFLAGVRFCFLSKIMISAIVLNKADLILTWLGYLSLGCSKCSFSSTEVWEAVFS